MNAAIAQQRPCFKIQLVSDQRLAVSMEKRALRSLLARLHPRHRFWVCSPGPFSRILRDLSY
jgi:hypothetical protein